MDFLNYNSVETLPSVEARAAFHGRAKHQGDNPVNSAAVFREDIDFVPTIIDDSLSYVPWDGDNQPLGSSTEWEINAFLPARTR